MPSATSTRARCSRANRGSSTTLTVRHWPCSGRRSTASAISPTRRRILRWRAPARWPPACRCWPSVQGSPSTRPGKSIVPPPHSAQPARAESWPASTRGYACGRPASRGIRHLPTSSSPTCRHLPRATRRSRGRARCCWLAIRRVRSTLLSRQGRGEVSTPCVWLSRRAIRCAAGRCSTACWRGIPSATTPLPA